MSLSFHYLLEGIDIMVSCVPRKYFEMYNDPVFRLELFKVM